MQSPGSGEGCGLNDQRDRTQESNLILRLSFGHVDSKVPSPSVSIDGAADVVEVRKGDDHDANMVLRSHDRPHDPLIDCAGGAARRTGRWTVRKRRRRE